MGVYMGVHLGVYAYMEFMYTLVCTLYSTHIHAYTHTTMIWNSPQSPQFQQQHQQHQPPNPPPPPRGELEEVLKLVKPQHFLPVHGEYAFLCRHAELAQELGVQDTSVIRNGQLLGVYDKRNAKTVSTGVLWGGGGGEWEDCCKLGSVWWSGRIAVNWEVCDSSRTCSGTCKRHTLPTLTTSVNFLNLTKPQAPHTTITR